jgi:hypothetical protein
MSQLQTNKIEFSFVDPQNNTKYIVAPGDALYDSKTGYINFLILRNLKSQKSPMFLKLFSQKVASVHRNLAILKIATTVIESMFGFDVLLSENDNELIDYLGDQGINYLGKGAAIAFSLATAREELRYYDAQTGKCVFNFVIIAS